MPTPTTFDLMVGRMENANDQDQVDAVSERVWELRDLNSAQFENRTLTRNILDGGVGGLRSLLGEDFQDLDPRVPAPNLMLSGLTSLAQKIGKVPSIRSDPASASDSDTARSRAAKRGRIISSYDRNARMSLQVSQLARWVPGYGFASFTVDMKRADNGQMYPHAAIRDPYTTFPAAWGVDQQPRDIAYVHIFTAQQLAKMFPDHEDRIRSLAKRELTGSQIPVVGSHVSHPGWENQKGSGVEVYEYVNVEGTWWVIPELKLLLSFVPNPLARRPPFSVVKRFSFNQLVGQYDHIIGLMASMARLNILSIIAAEDAVFAETIVTGDMRQGMEWQRGRDAVNFLEPNASASKLNSNVGQELFQQIDRIERQLRVTSRYSVMDDAQSPSSWATGRGLEELTTAPNNEVAEYFKASEWGFVDLDAIRLEMDEAVTPNTEKSISGIHQGESFNEKYRPRTHINGNYDSRRMFGAMASMDEPTKMVTMLNLMQADVIDDWTVQENIDGLENVQRIRERIRQKNLEDISMQFLLARAEQGDVASMNAVIEMMRDSEVKTILQDVFIPDEEEEQQFVQEQQQPTEQDIIGQQPPDVMTALTRLTGSGETMGVQNVGRF